MDMKERIVRFLQELEVQDFLGSFRPEKETHNRDDAELDRLLFDIITKGSES